MKKDNKKEVVKNYLKGEILVVIDAANLENSVKAMDWWIDYIKLKNLFQKNLVEIRYYCVSYNNMEQNKFFAFLKKQGYKLVTKPVKIIKAPERDTGSLRKANFDVEITYDVVEKINEFDTLVLFSGDSDFEYLIKKIKGKGKRVIVISSKHHISKELIRHSYKYIDLKKLKESIERKKESPPFSAGS